MQDSVSFIKQWYASPLQVASIVPSSRALSRLITSQINADTGPIIELGPGTGVFTKALLECGVRQEQLALIELNENFAEDLKIRFPKAQVYCMSATQLSNKTFFKGGVGAIVSGLGLLSMPKNLVAEILDGVFTQLRPGASLYQFTYGPTCPLPPEMFEKFNLAYERIGKTRRNIPPATVYRIYRSSEA